MDTNLKTEDMIYLREMEPTETASDYLNKYIKAEIIPLANNTIADLKAELADLNTEIANLKIDLAKKERDQAESAVLKASVEVKESLEEMRQALANNNINANTHASVDDYEVVFKLDKIIEANDDIKKTLTDVNYNVSRLNDNNKIEEVVPNNISNIYPEANLVTNVEPAPAEIQNIVAQKEENNLPTDVPADIESAKVEEPEAQKIVPNEVPTEPTEAAVPTEESKSVEEPTEDKETVSAGVNPEDKPQYNLPTDTVKPEENIISSIPNANDETQSEENVAQAEGNNNIYPSADGENKGNEIEETKASDEVPAKNNNEGPTMESSVEPTPTFDGEPLTPTGTKIGRSALEEVKKDIFVVKTSDFGEEISHFPKELKERLDGLLGIEKTEEQETSMKRAA